MSKPFLPTTLATKPWRIPSGVCAGAPWGLLRDGEGQLLYHLARDHYRGAGVIVDGGSFLGRSAWLLATGLDQNPHLPADRKPPIHCFDNFIVNDSYTTEVIEQQFGVHLPLGASTRHLFDTAVAPVIDRL
jgi:hypothetical protein